MIAVLSGFVAGLLHVLSGPDHLAAIAPLSVEGRSRAWNTGLRWGLGHAGGVLLVGLLSLGLRGVLPVNLLSSWAERLVGVVLIGIGIWGVRRALLTHVHAHRHTHGGHTHVHVHVHTPAAAHAHAGTAPHSHTHAAFAIGTLHGLAGGSHFLGVLPALAFPTDTQAISYLAAFGVGTMAAMASFASVLGWVAQHQAFGGAKAYRALMIGCSVAAMAVGIYWMVG